jgi:hypothetical protein
MGLSVAKKIIMLGLKVIIIWSHNPKAMDNKTRLSETYIKKPNNKNYKEHTFQMKQMKTTNNGGKFLLQNFATCICFN